ncbi:hypothetical protein FRB94_014387 [Tulasnella sp. JGI-2019a]|nr:hypothetical protein FRB94_014387 [Tulasnella sp. JGI-2019a]
MQKQIQNLLYHSSDHGFVEMYLGNTGTVEETRVAVDDQLSAIPILLMMESAYKPQECFVPVTGVDGMYELPFFWRVLSQNSDIDSKLAVIETIHGMDLLSDQECYSDLMKRRRDL